MSLLTTCPKEIIASIFMQCPTVGDAISLAATCPRTHQVWEAEKARILTKHFRTRVFAFDLALAAVSMTIVAAYKNR
jgi:hypothetical protein